MESEFLYSATLQFPFKSQEEAKIAARTLSVDDDLKPNDSVNEFGVSNNFLVFSVRARSAKHLKKAITTTLPSIELIQNTVDAFRPE
jgi:tRNA threonylcarbamoyladenosine modification (KEOPS) complex  Pcc1 subunit